MMKERSAEAKNLQLLLASPQEKDVRLGLDLASSAKVILKDLTRLTALALLHKSKSLRTSGMEALQSQTTTEEFDFIRQNWDTTYLHGKAAVLFDALARLGGSERIDANQLMRLNVQMRNVFPQDRVTDYPEAFRAFCESQLKESSWSGETELNLLYNAFPLLPREFTSWKVIRDLDILHLHQCGLKRLPADIGSLKKLKLLNVNDNKLRIFPESIEGLESLETLNLEGNPLELFPDGISKLPRLENLEVNLRKRVDYHAIGECRQLKVLKISSSKHPDPFSFISNLPALDRFEFLMDDLPQVIPIPDSLPEWKKLRFAELLLSPEQPFPAFVTQIPTLRDLEIGFANDFPEECQAVLQPNLNKITLKGLSWTEWPESWSHFPKLWTLQLEMTQLTALPDCFSICQDLSHLYLAHSPIKSLPPFVFQFKRLGLLMLSNLEIDAIPEEICELKGLNSLIINGCPIRKLPESLKKMTWMEEIKLTNLKLNKQDVLDLKTALPNTMVKWA